MRDLELHPSAGAAPGGARASPHRNNSSCPPRWRHKSLEAAGLEEPQRRPWSCRAAAHGWMERWKTTKNPGTAELGWNCSSQFIPGRTNGARIWSLGWSSAEIIARVFFHQPAPKVAASKARRVHCPTVKSILQLCQCLKPKCNQLIKYFIVNFNHYVTFLKTEL